MKKVYISGKITGIKLANAKINFYFAGKEVRDYHDATHIVNPFDIKPLFGLKIWICYMVNDIRQQKKCTHSAFQSNWKDSKGAVIEYYFAKFIFKHEIIFL